VVDIQALRQAFRTAYQAEPRVFSAPGRVNLIGEHTDYNDGFVLPMAIERRTFVAAAKRLDRRVRCRSLNASQAYEFDLEQPGSRRRNIWLDYVEGTARALLERDFAVTGADLLIESDVPTGAGLSSSAALEMSVGLAFCSLAENAAIDRVKLALAGQAAEHQYVGTMCGIMDQYIASLGRSGKALLIDCRTLKMTEVPLDLREAVVVICDSRVQHELASSEYNIRRSECHAAVESLKRVLPDIVALRDVTPEQLDLHRELLPEPVLSRCRHVVTENARTLRAADALGRGDLQAFGRLMAASHASLQSDYQVSCAELDALVEAALRQPGVYGARMTGGGFGGCTVNLVRTDAVEPFRQSLTTSYERAFGKRPQLFVSRAADGAREEP
jgi:galactokinase